MPGSIKVYMERGVLVDPVLKGVMLEKGWSKYLVLT